MPSMPTGPPMVTLLRKTKPRGIDPGPDVTVPVPSMLWMHGGGHLFGSPEQDDRSNIAFVRKLGIARTPRRSHRAPSGVDRPCELYVVPGATHGFDQLFARAEVTKEFWQKQPDALRNAGFTT